MEANNEFDKKLELWGNNTPIELKSSAIKVVDTLDLAWAGVKVVFGEKQAQPEHALKILELILQDVKTSSSETD